MSPGLKSRPPRRANSASRRDTSPFGCGFGGQPIERLNGPKAGRKGSWHWNASLPQSLLCGAIVPRRAGCRDASMTWCPITSGRCRKTRSATGRCATGLKGRTGSSTVSGRTAWTTAAGPWPGPLRAPRRPVTCFTIRCKGDPFWTTRCPSSVAGRVKIEWLAFRECASKAALGETTGCWPGNWRPHPKRWRTRT